jgi:hypothetical protein
MMLRLAFENINFISNKNIHELIMLNHIKYIYYIFNILLENGNIKKKTHVRISSMIKERFHSIHFNGNLKQWYFSIHRSA